MSQNGVQNNQVANQTTFNNAFMKENGDTGTIGKIDLKNSDSASGTQITNLQKEVNNLFSFLGALKDQLIGYLPTFLNSNGFTATQSVVDRAEAISAKFHESTGHTHSGTAGDGSKISSTNLNDVPLRGYPILGTDIYPTESNSMDVSAQMTLKTPSSGTSDKGVVVSYPYNKVVLFKLSGPEADDVLTDEYGNTVYGRITESGGVWTLSFFVNIDGDDLAYTMTEEDSTTGLKWFFQELFNPIVDAPTYNELFFVQSENATADVVDASATQRGLMNTITQAFSGIKYFLNPLVVVDYIQFLGSSSGAVNLKSPASATPYNFVFPDSAGLPSQVMKTDGSGNTYWETIAGADPYYNTAVFKANGLYPVGAGIDGTYVFREASTIDFVAMSRQVAGSSGYTQVDILIKPPSGSWTSIFTTKPAVNPTAGNDAVTYTGLAGDTSKDAPVLVGGAVNVAVGTQMRMDITYAEGGPRNSVACYVSFRKQ